MVHKSLLACVLFVLPALAQNAYVERLNQVPDTKRLWEWHDLLAAEPHIAGTEGDWRVINTLAESFGEMGYEVDVHEIWPLLSYPVSAEVEVLHPDIEPGAGLLPVREMALAQDPFSDDEDLTIGFNAYAGSGEAIGEVVYANRGRKEDFERLREMGIDCTGKIVIARYGGNYRGYKAKFAEEAGAAGLLIFLDPGDSGFVRGTEYPDGGWQTPSCIQRGSIVTLPYKGDPLTPFAEATEDAARLAIDDVALPRIPVQPIGWGAAREILVRMEGSEAPEGWRGGMPIPYLLTGGPDLRVRVNVQQERKISKTANVIARMEGSEYPDQWIIVGCHHDAWGHGAGDAMCGMISLMESARSFADLAAQGWRPKRTIIFAGWGAEEYGIIGSSEWVEANASELSEKAVAYINMDMASMGPNFRASASPSLRRLVVDAARDVPQARAPETTVLEDWVGRAPRSDDPTRPRIGNLGGGSDHVGFVCHLGVPGLSLGAGGSQGVSYHTAYDNLAWYRKVVGEDYEPALMIARMANSVVGRLAGDDIVPIDVGAEYEYVADQLRRLRQDSRVADHGLTGRIDDAIAEADRVAARMRLADALAVETGGVVRFGLKELPEPSDSAMSEEDRATLESVVRALDKDVRFREFAAQQSRQALTGAAAQEGAVWYRSALVAPDPDSGYSSWALPFVRAALESGDADRVVHVLAELAQRVSGVAQTLDLWIEYPEPGQ